MNKMAAVQKLQDAFRARHGMGNFQAKTGVGASDLTDALGTARGGTDVAPLLPTNAVPDFLLANGARRVSPGVRMLTRGDAAVAGWRGRGGKSIRVSKFDIQGSSLEVLGVGAITVAANESLADSGMQGVLAENLTNAIDKAVNAIALDPDNSGSDDYPAALVSGALQIHSGGTGIVNVAHDIESAFRELSDLGSPMRNVVVLVHSRTAAHLATWRTTEGVPVFPQMTPSGGILCGVPCYASADMPNVGSPTESFLIALDASDVVVADLGARAALSDETAIEMDTTPTGDTTTPDAASATIVSMYQAEATAIKVVRRVNWAMHRGFAVVVNQVAY